MTLFELLPHPAWFHELVSPAYHCVPWAIICACIQHPHLDLIYPPFPSTLPLPFLRPLPPPPPSSLPVRDQISGRCFCSRPHEMFPCPRAPPCAFNRVELTFLSILHLWPCAGGMRGGWGWVWVWGEKRREERGVEWGVRGSLVNGAFHGPSAPRRAVMALLCSPLPSAAGYNLILILQIGQAF